MSFQYALRFESGERSGEVIPVTVVGAPGGAFTIGRKPGNSLQVTDPSVSGRHAEFEIAGENLQVRDLGSTNGTEVSGRRVTEAIVSHGDEITLGKVQFTLVDQTRASAKLRAATSDSEAPSGVVTGPEGLAETRIQPRDEAIEITAADLERSKKSSKLVPLVVAALALIAAGVWWWQSQGGDDERSEGRARDVAPVVPPDGNLLVDGYSFEKAGGWILETEELTSPFDLTRAGAASGRRGAFVELEPGGRAILEHEPVRIQGSVRVTAQVRASADAAARIGLKFRRGPEGAAGGVIWSAPVIGSRSGSDGAHEFAVLEVLVQPPAGMDYAEVVLEGASKLPVAAAAESDDPTDDSVEEDLVEVAFDDVALVPAPEAEELYSFASWRVFPLAAAADWTAPFAFAITALDEAPIPLIQLRTKDDEPLAATVVLSDGDAVIQSASDPSPGSTVAVRVDQSLASQGIATLRGNDAGAAPTYATHGGSFEREGVTSLLVGRGSDLVRLKFDAPVDLRARTSGDDVVFHAPLGPAKSVTLQFDFKEERVMAQRLGRRARDERQEGRSHDALETWNEVLRDYPFQYDLVEEAVRTEAEITAEGRRELESLIAEVDRARFFQLADIYREKLIRVNALAERYRGSDVEPAARSLAEVIEGELATFGEESREHETRRLEAIEQALAREGAEKLGARVGTYRENELMKPHDGASNGHKSDGMSSGEDS